MPGTRARFIIVLSFLSLVFLGTPSFAVVSPWYPGLSYAENGSIDLSVYGRAWINTYTGNLGLHRELFSIPGKGLPVEIYLTYNSDHRLISSPFGYGWNFSYHIRYQKDASGNVTIVWGDGRQDTFTKTDSGYAPPPGIHMTLTENSSSALILTTKYGFKFIFSDSAHRKLTSIQDPNGNAVTIGYDTAYRPVSITDAGGRVYTLTYNAAGLLAKVEDGNLTDPRDYAFTYDSQGRLTGITDPQGQQETFSYDTDNLITTITDKRGNATTITYATPVNGSPTRLPRSIAKGTRSIDFAFDATTSTTTYTDANGNDWQLEYTTPISKIIDPAGKATAFDWDNDKNLTSITDRNQNTTTLTYDSQGNLLTVRDASDKETRLAYGNLSRLTGFTDRRGKTWTLTYDSAGNPIQTVDPAGNKIIREFDPQGQMTAWTDREENTHRYEYDSNGNLVSWKDPLGNTMRFTYDEAGRLTQITDANGYSVGLTYEVLDRLRSIADGTGNSDQRNYDANGNLVRYRDRMGSEWSLSYNTWDELTQIAGPPIPDPNDPSNTLNPTVSLARDGNGNITRLTNPLGNNWIFGYDKLDHLVNRKDPLGNTWQYAYDPEGNLAQLTNALGKTTTYTYDPLGRLTRQSFPDNTTATFTYDPEGNLLTAQDASSSYTMSYDDLGRLSRFTDNLAGKTFSLGYDGEGRLISKAYPGGETLTFSYNAAGHRTAMTTPNGTTTYDYDPAGNLTQITYHSGDATAYSYDANNRVLRIEHKSFTDNIFASYAYTRDANGRVTHSERNGQILVADYTYDPYGRITQEVFTDNFINPPRTTTFTSTYDPAGRLVAYERDWMSGTVTWDTAARPNSDSGWWGSGASFTHDANGSRTQIDIAGSLLDLAYDARGRLVGVNDGYKPTTYTYDVFNRIIGEQQGGVDQRFLYGDPFSSMPNEIHDGNGNIVVKFYKNVGIPTDFKASMLADKGVAKAQLRVGRPDQALTPGPVVTLSSGNTTETRTPYEFSTIDTPMQPVSISGFPADVTFSSTSTPQQLRVGAYINSIITIGPLVGNRVRGLEIPPLDSGRIGQDSVDPIVARLAAEFSGFPGDPLTLARNFRPLLEMEIKHVNGDADIRTSRLPIGHVEIQIPPANPDNSTSEDQHIHPLPGDLPGPGGSSIFLGPYDPNSGEKLPFDVKVGDAPKVQSIPGERYYWSGRTYPPFSDWQKWFTLPGCYETTEPTGGAICGGRSVDRWHSDGEFEETVL